uniref:Uncharacterized protein n=1 Tax=Sphaerodactylus townsendi TaxID=933632 RepID=A0ACB8G081_9SAUR
MVSSPHSEHPPKKGYDFDTVNEQTCQTYRFGAAAERGGGAGGGQGGGGGGGGGRLSIDASLTKLFECMTLAYRLGLLSWYGSKMHETRTAAFVYTASPAALDVRAFYP